MKTLALVLAVCCLVGVFAADDICQEISGSSAQLKQSLPNDFVVDIEDVQGSIVKNYRMFYSKADQIIRLDVMDAQVTSSMYFYFKDNEILTFDHSVGRGKCTVNTDLSNSVDDFLFGGTPTKTKNPSTPAPLALVHFLGRSGFGDHQIKRKLVTSKAKIRSKDAKMYTSCQHWKSAKNDIVLNVTHYFAADKYQFPDTQGVKNASTLLQMTMQGTGKVGGNPNVKVDYIYNFFDFRKSDDMSKMLETPEGIYCKGRKVDKTFPKLPSFIRFTGEGVDPKHHIYYSLEELYNYDSKIAMFTTSNRADTDSNLNRLTTVWDFPQNKLFNLDHVKLTCTHSDLNTTQPTANIYDIINHKAKMVNSSNFFFADESAFTYLGQKTIRGMTTEVWVAPTNRLKGKPNAVVEYYFAPPVSSWNDHNQEYLKNHYPVPLKWKLWSDDTDTQPTTENIFHVDYNPVRPDYVDLSPCYPYQIHFQFALKGKKAQIDNSYVELFKFNAIQSLANAGGMSPLQVSAMKLYFAKKDVYMEFIIGGLGPASTATISDKIISAIKSGTLRFNVRDPKTEKWDRPLSIDEMSTVDVFQALLNKKKGVDDGYSKGAMAGVGIAMVVVGIAAGAGAGFAHSKFL